MTYRSLTYTHNFRSIFVSHWINIRSIIFIHQLVFEMRQNLWCPRYWSLAPPQSMSLGMKADAAGLTEVKPLVKYQLATISRAQESTYDKILNHGKLAKVWSQQTVKYRTGGHGSCLFLLVSQRYILIWSINLLPLIGLETLPWTKTLTLIIWPSPKSVKYRSWGHGSCIFLLVSYYQYALIWNINLPPLTGLKILLWTKPGLQTEQPERSKGGLSLRGHKSESNINFN